MGAEGGVAIIYKNELASIKDELFERNRKTKELWSCSGVWI